MKILIVKTSSMGDVVHALPVLSDIKANFADCDIDWLVEEPFADIVRASPLVRKVHLSKVRTWRKSLFSRQTQYEIYLLRQALKSENYDLVIDLQGLYKSAILAKLASAPIAGYTFSSAREGGASFFYNKKYQVSKNKSAVARCRELAAKALGYSVPTNQPVFNFGKIQPHFLPNEREFQVQERKSQNLEEELEPPTQSQFRSAANSQFQFSVESQEADINSADLNRNAEVLDRTAKTAIFFVNASRKTKLWPESYWVELGKQLVKQGFKILLPWGSKEDSHRVNRIATGIGEAAEVPSHQTIGQLMTKIISSSLIVGLDTGMTHLGSAMAIPTVGLFLDYPIELVPLVGQGKKVALGGIGNCPQCGEVLNAISEVLK